MSKVTHSPFFFARDADGSVRLRFRLDGEEASLIEEAAGSTPLMVWIHKTLRDGAEKQVTRARARRPEVAPPD